MDEDVTNYVLSLAEQDAINAISNAKAQGREALCSFTKTEAYEAYNQARDIMRDLLWIGTADAIGNPASVSEQRQLARKPILSLKNLKFAFYEAKARYQPRRHGW